MLVFKLRSVMRSSTRKRLNRSRDFIRQSYDQTLSLEQIASHANLSTFHFLRTYKKMFHETPHDFVTRLRIEKAKALLANHSHNVTEACFEVGFSSLGSFSMLFTKQVGIPPSEFQTHARSSIVVPHPVRSIFVPSCFASAYFGS